MRRCLDRMSEESRNAPLHEQDDDQQVFELLQENRPRCDPMTGLKFIGPLLQQTAPRLGSR